MDKIKLSRNGVTLKDTLHNISIDVAQSPEQEVYGRGVLVGVIGTFVAQLDSFEDAVKFVRNFTPPFINPNCVPDSWKKEFEL